MMKWTRGWREKKGCLLPVFFFYLLTRFLLLVGPPNFPKDGSFEANKGEICFLSNPSRRRGGRGNSHGEKILGRDILPGPSDFCYSGCLSDLAVPRFPMPSSWIRAMQIFKSVKTSRLMHPVLKRLDESGVIPYVWGEISCIGFSFIQDGMQETFYFGPRVIRCLGSNVSVLPHQWNIQLSILHLNVPDAQPSRTPLRGGQWHSKHWLCRRGDYFFCVILHFCFLKIPIARLKRDFRGQPLLDRAFSTKIMSAEESW